jgi:hypothetical protein
MGLSDDSPDRRGDEHNTARRQAFTSDQNHTEFRSDSKNLHHRQGNVGSEHHLVEHINIRTSAATRGTGVSLMASVATATCSVRQWSLASRGHGRDELRDRSGDSAERWAGTYEVTTANFAGSSKLISHLPTVADNHDQRSRSNRDRGGTNTLCVTVRATPLPRQRIFPFFAKGRAWARIWRRVSLALQGLRKAKPLNPPSGRQRRINAGNVSGRRSITQAMPITPRSTAHTKDDHHQQGVGNVDPQTT